MAKSLFLVASLLLLLPLSLAAAEPQKAPAAGGGYRPIENINDPYIQSLGKFAVEEHNEQAKADLKFQKVIGGLVQTVDGGTNYSLRLSAVEGSVSRIYSAVVFKDLKGKLHLDDFFGISN